MIDTVNAATDNGAEDSGTPEQRQPSLREQMMAQLEEQHENLVTEQLRRQTPEPTPRDAENGMVLVDDPKRFALKVKIGDREEDRSLDTVVNELHSLQGRVRSLSQRERDLAAALAEKERLLNQQVLAQINTDETTDDLDARVSTVMSALIEGDEDTATNALRDILKSGRQKATPVDEGQIVGRLKAELQQEQQEQQMASVWESFVAENPEFRPQESDTGEVVLTEERQYGDYLYEREYAKRVEAGEISYQQALIDTAEKVRKVFSAKAEPRDPFDSRRERKKQLDQLPAASGSRAGGSANAADASPSDVIREMRRARGLPD